MMLHLGDATYWNYKSRVKCEKCGVELEIEIEDGKVVYVRKIK